VLGYDDTSKTLDLLHAGVPLSDFLASRTMASPEAVADLYFQLTWNLCVAAILCGVRHRDLHLGNILVNLKPCV